MWKVNLVLSTSEQTPLGITYTEIEFIERNRTIPTSCWGKKSQEKSLEKIFLSLGKESGTK